MTSKMTKTEMFTAIRDYFAGNEMDERATNEAIMEFCDNEIAILDKRAVKAKERAAEKKAQGDELTETVFSLLTEEPMSRQEVTDLVNDPEVTLAKVGYRLSALVKAGRAVKEDAVVVGEDGKSKKMAVYRLA
jgi:hypothetical protein